VRIGSPSSYLEDLRAAYVLADANERREIISKRTEELATRQEGTAIVPPALLDEVTALVEWPVPLVCSFEERFLDVPQEALITTMQDNQKYFCLLDADGKLLPRFITVANIESKDPQQIIAGNEKGGAPTPDRRRVLLQARQEAEARSLQRAPEERGVPGKARQRLRQGRARFQTGRVHRRAHRRQRRVGRSCRPAVQVRPGRNGRRVPGDAGVAGYYYALNDGEPEDVALALNEQYMPRGAGAELPATLTGAAVAIADKLDTLVGIFGIGMLPTGSKDPYALRRAALGVLRILIEKKLDLDLNDAVAFAVNAFGAKVKAAGLAERCWSSSSTACVRVTKTKASTSPPTCRCVP
jgi:glycyl-tRNA synthetase beta chain